MARISRKKYQEALRCLKQACKNERLSFTLRIRAAELICLIYGLPPLESSARIKRTVKELVQEGTLDRQIREQVADKVRQDAEAQARRFLESVSQPSGGQ
jgi:ribosomal protein L22